MTRPLLQRLCARRSAAWRPCVPRRLVKPWHMTLPPWGEAVPQVGQRPLVATYVVAEIRAVVVVRLGHEAVVANLESTSHLLDRLWVDAHQQTGDEIH